MKNILLFCVVCVITFGACSNKSEEDLTYNPQEQTNPDEDIDTTNTFERTLNILALGDSYTIGQSVCETCRFPAQLKNSLANKKDNDSNNPALDRMIPGKEINLSLLSILPSQVLSLVKVVEKLIALKKN